MGARYTETNEDHWETIFKMHLLNQCTIPGWGGTGGFQKKGAQACAISGSFHSAPDVVSSLVESCQVEVPPLYPGNKQFPVLGKMFVL